MRNTTFRFASALAIKSLTLAALFFGLNIIIRAAGVLDSTFGVNGRVSTSVGDSATARAMAIQPDGKIVVAGDFTVSFMNRDIVLARFNSNGTLDASFGSGGKVFATISPDHEEVNAVALQPDGKIVVAGSFYSPLTASIDFLFVRFNHDGGLDTTFGTNGVATINQGSSEAIYAVVVQPDGKIVGVGRTSNSDYHAAVIRLNPNGSLDSSFGGGLVLFDLPNFHSDVFQTVGLLPNGRIVAGGLAQNVPAQPILFAQFLVAFEPNGARAQNFGSQGVVTETSGLFPNFPRPESIRIAVTPDGKILAKSEVSLRRYLGDGSSDETFRRSGGDDGSLALRSDGRIVMGFSPKIYSTRGDFIGRTGNINGGTIAVQADDKIVVASSPGTDFVVTRISTITSQGTRLTSSERSLMVYRPSNRTRYALSALGGFEALPTAVEATKIIPEFFGSFSAAPPPRLVYWQAPNAAGAPAYFRGDFNFDGVEDNFQWGASGDIPVGGDYDGDTRTDFTVYRPSQGVWYISQSRFNQPLAVQFGTNGDKPVPADYDYDGTTDIAVYRPSNGTWYIRRSSDGGFFGVQFGAAEDIPLTGDFDGDGRADFVVFRPSSGVWYQLLTTAGFKAVQFGFGTDAPVPGDYDGDGRHDIAVFRQGIWYLLQSTEGLKAVQWGTSGDVPAVVRYDQ